MQIDIGPIFYCYSISNETKRILSYFTIKTILVYIFLIYIYIDIIYY